MINHDGLGPVRLACDAGVCETPFMCCLVGGCVAAIQKERTMQYDSKALDSHITGNYGADQFPANPTLAERIAATGITMTAKPTTHAKPLDFPGGSTWRCTIRRADTLDPHTVRVTFHMGEAHTAAPTINDVMECLLSDASIAENAGTFQAFCDEFGYDLDSRKAYRTWKNTVSQTAKLKDLLGDAYDDWLWNTENE